MIFSKKRHLHRPFTMTLNLLPRNNRCFLQMQLWTVWWLKRWVTVLLNFKWVTQDKCVHLLADLIIFEKKFLPKCSTKFVVVHVWLVFSHPPQLGHFVGVYKAKLSSPILLPTNDLRVLFGVGQQFKQKLPKLNLSTLRLTGRWKEMSVIGFCDFWNITKICWFIFALSTSSNWWINVASITWMLT